MERELTLSLEIHFHSFTKKRHERCRLPENAAHCVYKRRIGDFFSGKVGGRDEVLAFEILYVKCILRISTGRAFEAFAVE